MKKIIAIVVFLLLAAWCVLAWSDISCFTECQRHGGSWQYCKKICGE
jgi:hypothetical protein